MTHGLPGCVVHKCLRASTKVEQPGIGATLTVSRVDRHADILQTRDPRTAFSVTTVRDSVPARSPGLRVNTGRSLATAVAAMSTSYARAVVLLPEARSWRRHDQRL